MKRGDPENLIYGGKLATLVLDRYIVRPSIQVGSNRSFAALANHRGSWTSYGISL